MIYKVYQHTESHERYKKKRRRKVSLLQCPSNLKQLNLKMGCFFYTNSFHS